MVQVTARLPDIIRQTIEYYLDEIEHLRVRVVEAIDLLCDLVILVVRIGHRREVYRCR